MSSAPGSKPAPAAEQSWTWVCFSVAERICAVVLIIAVSPLFMGIWDGTDRSPWF
jgi:hypothetical protein